MISLGAEGSTKKRLTDKKGDDKTIGENEK